MNYNSTGGVHAKYRCKKHTDREIEYFCKGWAELVWSKWMFLHHNGHSLWQFEDAIALLSDGLDKVSEHLTKANDLHDSISKESGLFLNQVNTMKHKLIDSIENEFKNIVKAINEK
jgi:hypothetical protein